MLYMETSFPALLTVLLLIALKKQILGKIKATFFKKYHVNSLLDTLFDKFLSQNESKRWII